MSNNNSPDAENSGSKTLQGQWQRARLPLLIAGPALVVIVAIYLFFTSGRYESTDDAYVMAARVAITSNVDGRVVEIDVHDNQPVRKGDVLFKLDETPFRIAVEEAQARLAAAILEVKTLKATYLEKRSELNSAEQTLAFQKTELERQQRLLQSGIASRSTVDRATHAFDEARERVASVQHEMAAARARLGGNPNIDPSEHPSVQQAQALLDRANLDLSYATVAAINDGIVTRVEQLQVGSLVVASKPLFALVSTDDVWIEANFKEDQLAHMRPGQEAIVKIDSYPGKTFKGQVASMSPGTGSQFSVLPAENATGNWVKVVQRLPVRVELDRADTALALQAGLSAKVEVDTSYRRHLFGSDSSVESTSAAQR
jgi:membrane fusion protein (multidrug efflux system)